MRQRSDQIEWETAQKQKQNKGKITLTGSKGDVILNQKTYNQFKTEEELFYWREALQ